MWKRFVLMMARKQRGRAEVPVPYLSRAQPQYSNFPSARPHLLKAALLSIAPRVEDWL